MSYFGDILDFEKFHLGDLWKKLKDNPEQALIGATDPFSAKVWGEATGKEYDPLFNVFGGPMGGDDLGLGGGGVYDRAAQAGINTKPSSQTHDLAEVISAYFSGSYGADQLGGLLGGSGSEGSGLLGGDSEGLGQLQSLMGNMPGGMGGQQPQPMMRPPSFSSSSYTPTVQGPRNEEDRKRSRLETVMAMRGLL